MTILNTAWAENELTTEGNWYSRIFAKINTSWRNLTGDTAWTALPLVNGWANYSAAQFGTAACMVRNDTVFLRGMVMNANNALTGQIGSLPAGYSPSANLSFHVVAGPGSARVDVNSDGTVILFRYNANGAPGNGTGAYVSLAGINFPWSSNVTPMSLD